MSQSQNSQPSPEKSITDRVYKILRDQLAIPADKEIKADAHFKHDLDADSLDLVELTMALEDEFGIEIRDVDAENWTTVQDALDYLVANVKSS